MMVMHDGAPSHPFLFPNMVIKFETICIKKTKRIWQWIGSCQSPESRSGFNPQDNTFQHSRRFSGTYQIPVRSAFQLCCNSTKSVNVRNYVPCRRASIKLRREGLVPADARPTGAQTYQSRGRNRTGDISQANGAAAFRYQGTIHEFP